MWKEDLELKGGSLGIDYVRYWDEVMWSCLTRFGRIQRDSGLFRGVWVSSSTLTAFKVNACGLLT